MTTLSRTLTLTFDEMRSLFKWKLELIKVMHCLNTSLIHDSYHSLRTVQLITFGLLAGGAIGLGPQVEGPPPIGMIMRSGRAILLGLQKFSKTRSVH